MMREVDFLLVCSLVLDVLDDDDDVSPLYTRRNDEKKHANRKV